jgi:hypothetical protein
MLELYCIAALADLPVLRVSRTKLSYRSLLSDSLLFSLVITHSWPPRASNKTSSEKSTDNNTNLKDMAD